MLQSEVVRTFDYRVSTNRMPALMRPEDLETHDDEEQSTWRSAAEMEKTDGFS